MKKLGLIGGTGPESTIEYYRQIEYGVQKKTGCFPNLVIESLSVFDVLSYCEKHDYDGLTAYLLRGLQCLADAGAQFACFTGITPHIVYERVAAKSPIPVISMVEAACEYAKSQNYKTVALLGTYPTMSGSFFHNTFRQHGVKVVTPSEEEMRFIGEKIEAELELGMVVDETRARMCEIAARLANEENAEAIVLGCTELPMILDENVLSMPCLDVMKVHIEKLISMIVH